MNELQHSNGIPVESRTTKEPVTLADWADMLARLVHVHIGPPKNAHNLPSVDCGISKPRSWLEDQPVFYKIYAASGMDVSYDALVTDVSFSSHKFPPEGKLKLPPRKRDELFPHGRLRLTIDLVLDKHPLTKSPKPKDSGTG